MEKHELNDFNKELDKVFDVENPIVKKSIKIIEETEKKNEIKKLKIVSWCAATISFIGILLNTYKIILCWPVWCVANIFWIYWAIKKKEGAQIVLWIVFTLANLYGWYMWFIT